MLIYLDQNIVGYLHEGRLRFDPSSNVQWVYSSEHFTEIARGGRTDLLAVFEVLKARQLEVILDDNFRITDSAHLHDYSNPFERYQRHLEAIGEVPVDTSPSLGNPPIFSWREKWSYVALSSFCMGVMPPRAMFGRSLL